MTDWEFVCDGCNRTSPEHPQCSVCGHRFVFHGTPEGDRVMAEAIERLRAFVDEKTPPPENK